MLFRSIRQTAVFEPHGLAGLTYWYSLYPVHALIFRGMLRGIAAQQREVTTRTKALSPA